MSVVFRAEGVQLKVGDGAAFSDIGFDLHAGEAIGITSTGTADLCALLEVFAGLRAPDAGQVRWRSLPGFANALHDKAAPHRQRYRAEQWLRRSNGSEVVRALGARGTQRIEVASTYLALGDLPRARAEAEAALIEVAGDDYLHGDALFVLGRALGRSGEFDAARSALAEALTLDKQLGRRRAIAKTLLILAEVEDLAGDPAAAVGFRGRAQAVEEALP